MHTGECDVLGEKMGGSTVQLGAAVARRATPGEILISHTVKYLVAGAGLEFIAEGAQTFAALPGEWWLFAVARGVEG